MKLLELLKHGTWNNGKDPKDKDYEQFDLIVESENYLRIKFITPALSDVNEINQKSQELFEKIVNELNNFRLVFDAKLPLSRQALCRENNSLKITNKGLNTLHDFVQSTQEHECKSAIATLLNLIGLYKRNDKQTLKSSLSALIQQEVFLYINSSKKDEPHYYILNDEYACGKLGDIFCELFSSGICGLLNKQIGSLFFKKHIQVQGIDGDSMAMAINEENLIVLRTSMRTIGNATPPPSPQAKAKMRRTSSASADSSTFNGAPVSVLLTPAAAVQSKDPLEIKSNESDLSSNDQTSANAKNTQHDSVLKEAKMKFIELLQKGVLQFEDIENGVNYTQKINLGINENEQALCVHITVEPNNEKINKQLFESLILDLKDTHKLLDNHIIYEPNKNLVKITVDGLRGMLAKNKQIIVPILYLVGLYSSLQKNILMSFGGLVNNNIILRHFTGDPSGSHKFYINPDIFDKESNELLKLYSTGLVRALSKALNKNNMETKAEKIYENTVRVVSISNEDYQKLQHALNDISSAQQTAVASSAAASPSKSNAPALAAASPAKSNGTNGDSKEEGNSFTKFFTKTVPNLLSPSKAASVPAAENKDAEKKDAEAAVSAVVPAAASAPAPAVEEKKVEPAEAAPSPAPEASTSTPAAEAKAPDAAENKDAQKKSAEAAAPAVVPAAASAPAPAEEKKVEPLEAAPAPVAPASTTAAEAKAPDAAENKDAQKKGAEAAAPAVVPAAASAPAPTEEKKGEPLTAAPAPVVSASTTAAEAKAPDAAENKDAQKKGAEAAAPAVVPAAVAPAPVAPTPAATSPAPVGEINAKPAAPTASGVAMPLPPQIQKRPAQVIATAGSTGSALRPAESKPSAPAAVSATGSAHQPAAVKTAGAPAPAVASAANSMSPPVSMKSEASPASARAMDRPPPPPSVVLPGSPVAGLSGAPRSAGSAQPSAATHVPPTALFSASPSVDISQGAKPAAPKGPLPATPSPKTLNRRSLDGSFGAVSPAQGPHAAISSQPQPAGLSLQSPAAQPAARKFPFTPAKVATPEARRIANAAQMNINSVVDLQTAKNHLDSVLFQYTIQPYSAKEVIRDSILDVFERVKNGQANVQSGYITEQLCDLFDYINLPKNKEKINLKANPRWDSFWSKPNSATWIGIVEFLRSEATQVLFREVASSFSLDSNAQANLMERLRNRDLFAQHTSNKYLATIGRTNAVKEIDERIHALRNPPKRHVRRHSTGG